MIILGLVDVGALSTNQVIVTNTGSEEFIRPTVRAGTDPARRLRIPASIRVEVTVSNTVEDTEDTTISVNGFNVLARVLI